MESPVTPMGMLLMISLDQWRLAWEVISGPGNRSEMALVMMGWVVISWMRVVSGLAITTRFPFGVQHPAETRVLARKGAEARASLMQATRGGVGPATQTLRAVPDVGGMEITRLGLGFGFSGLEGTAAAVA